MARTEVAIVAIIGNAVAVVAAALLPVAVLGLPVARAMLLPVAALFAFLAVLLLRGLHFGGLVMGLLVGVLLLLNIGLLLMMLALLILLHYGLLLTLLLLRLLILLPLSLLLLLLALLVLLPLGLLLLLFRSLSLLLLVLLLLFRSLSLLLLVLLLLFRSLSLLLLVLLLLFRSLSLLLLVLLLLFRSLSLLLLVLLLVLLLFGFGLLLLLLLLSRVRRSTHSHKEKKCGRTNDSNSFHGVTSIASTCAPLIRPIRRVNCQACTCFNLSRAESGLFARHPTRIREREWNNPNTFKSHNTTPMTTTPFKIDLILPAMGMKRFTSHNRTPTTIRVNRICMRGMLFHLSVFAAKHFHTGPTNCCRPCLARRTG